jgi:hypothetical protein
MDMLQTSDIANKASLIRLGRLAVAVSGAILCNYLELMHPSVSRFAVGAIFGIVILVWRSQSVRDLGNWRSAAFLAVSTVIYIVVKAFPAHTLGEIDTLSEVVEGFWSLMLDGIRFFVGVLFHTITLPVAHALLLGASLKRLSRYRLLSEYGLRSVSCGWQS